VIAYAVFCSTRVIFLRSGTLYMWAIAGCGSWGEYSRKILIKFWQYSANRDYNASRSFFTAYSNIREDCFTRYVCKTWKINSHVDSCSNAKFVTDV